MKKHLAALMIAGSIIPATADSLEVANGLATILINETSCGYQIDQSALEAYYSANHLDTPESLSFIDSRVSLAKMGDRQPSRSDCTISKVTGQKLGIIQK